MQGGGKGEGRSVGSETTSILRVVQAPQVDSSPHAFTLPQPLPGREGSTICTAPTSSFTHLLITPPPLHRLRAGDPDFDAGGFELLLPVRGDFVIDDEVLYAAEFAQ